MRRRPESSRRRDCAELGRRDPRSSALPCWPARAQHRLPRTRWRLRLVLPSQPLRRRLARRPYRHPCARVGQRPDPEADVAALGCDPARTFAEARATALQAVLEDMVRSGAPDAIAAVITEEGSWAGAAGIAGAKGRKATSEDEFAIASITKTFTAALVLRLAEQGRMDLDEPLASYMGDLKVDTNGATVRQALEMRSGLADYPQPAAANHIRVDAAHVWTAEEMVAEMDPPIAAAGETYLYSSAAYELLGRASRTCDRRRRTHPRCGRSWSTRGTSAGSSDKDPNARRPSRGLCRSTTTSSPGRQRTSASAARSAASRRRRTGPVRARSPATLRPSRPGSGTCSPATSCPTALAGTHGSPGKRIRLWAGISAVRRVARSALRAGRPAMARSSRCSRDDRAVIVIFVNDPDFVVEPTVSALLEAATAS